MVERDCLRGHCGRGGGGQDSYICSGASGNGRTPPQPIPVKRLEDNSTKKEWSISEQRGV